MAWQNDDGGGSTGFTCRISPSDMVGIVDNLLARIQDLETKVARLATANVEANQLSDISQQVGWVTGVTYMGTEGWTQTSAGTLIPPAGVSLSSLGILMSDGNQYPMVVMDENGVLQYGFSSTGQVVGEATPGGNYLLVRPISTTLSITGAPDLSDVIRSKGTAIGQDRLDEGAFTFSKTGLYLITAVVPANLETGGGSSLMAIGGTANGQSILSLEVLIGRGAGIDYNSNQCFSASALFAVPSTNNAVIGFDFTAVTNLLNIDKAHISVARIGDV